jgi:hypothetical protein
MIKKRYIVKIYDTELGGEYEFDSDNFFIKSEKGLYFEKNDKGLLNIKHNNQERHQIFIWTGFDKWEDFINEVSDDE